MMRLCAILAGAVAAQVSAGYLDAHTDIAAGDVARTLLLLAALVFLSKALPGARAKARRDFASDFPLLDGRLPPSKGRSVTLSLRGEPTACKTR